MPIGVRVTLRKERMYEFLEKTYCFRASMIRDLKELTISLMEEKLHIRNRADHFPKSCWTVFYKIMGMNVTFILQ